MKLTVLVTVVLLVLGNVKAAPGPGAPPAADATDITDQINTILDHLLGDLDDPLLLNERLELRVDYDLVAHVYLAMANATVAGVRDVAAHNCSTEAAPDDRHDLRLSVRAPALTLTTPLYFMNGSFVDHINVHGQGPASVAVEDLDITVRGTGRINLNLLNFWIVFDEITLDLEMRRWKVDFEGLMPGTDLGEVFNSFFSMCGPEILDILEKKVNEEGSLLDFINGLFPPRPS